MSALSNPTSMSSFSTNRRTARVAMEGVIAGSGGVGGRAGAGFVCLWRSFETGRGGRPGVIRPVVVVPLAVVVPAAVV